MKSFLFRNFDDPRRKNDGGHRRGYLEGETQSHHDILQEDWTGMLFQVWWRKHEIDCEVHPALLPILPVMDLNESGAMHASGRHFPSVLDLPDLA